jgi:hypothetical protein
MSVLAIPEPRSAVHVALEAAAAGVARAAAVAPATVTGRDLGEAVAAAARLEAQVAALRLGLLAEADRRQVAADTGASGTDAWVAKLTGSTPRAAAAGVRLARLLTGRYAGTREAFAAGTINADQTRVIVEAAERLPADVTVEERAVAEAGLVAKATAGMDAARLRHAARRMLEAVPARARVDDPVVRADHDEATRLQAEERAAHQATWMSLGDNGDGTWTGKFSIPDLHGHLLRAALERLTAPRRLVRNNAGDVVTDPTLPDAAGETLSWTERLGHGFCELLEHLPTDGFGRGGMGLMIHLDLDQLVHDLRTHHTSDPGTDPGSDPGSDRGSARLDSGARLSPGEARRLACAAGLIPAVLGTASVPLDLGRETRLHTTGQARALSAAYQTCAAEGCQRPFAWCDIHHRHPWSQGGTTDLTNAVPLCGWHHHRIHDTHYDHRYLPTGEVRYRRRR